MAVYPSRTPGELGSLIDRVEALERNLRIVTSPTAEQYAQAVAGLNKVDSASGSALGIGMQNVAGSGVFFEWVNLALGVAAGKTRVDGQIIASAALVDMTSGGLARSSLRIVTTYPDGTTETSVAFPAAKDAGASAVNNVMTGVARVSRANLLPGQIVRVSIQVSVSNPDAYPPNTGNYVAASGIYVSSGLMI